MGTEFWEEIFLQMPAETPCLWYPLHKIRNIFTWIENVEEKKETSKGSLKTDQSQIVSFFSFF